MLRIRLSSSSQVSAEPSLGMCGHFIVSPCMLLVFLRFNYSLIFVYFWLHWVFVNVCGLSLAAASRATLPCLVQASHCGSLSCSTAWTPGCTDFSSCGSRASLLHSRRDLPRPGIDLCPLHGQVDS